MLRSSDGTIYNLVPQTSRAALAPVIDLFLGTITGVTVDGNDTIEYDGNGNPTTALGALTVDFADGAQITVPAAASPYDDSWELFYGYDQPDSRIRPRLRRITPRWAIQAWLARRRAMQRAMRTAELSRS